MNGARPNPGCFGTGTHNLPHCRCQEIFNDMICVAQLRTYRDELVEAGNGPQDEGSPHAEAQSV